LKRLIVSLLAFAVWLIPIKTAGALTQHNIYEQPFINYAQFHSQQAPQSTNNSPSGTSLKQSSTRNDSASTSSYSGRYYSKEEVQDLIRYYSEIYKIDSDTPLCIARLESGFNQFSANRSSSARGVFQYLNGTWAATDEGKSGLSVFDADANVRAAVKYMSIHKNTKPWVVAPNCPILTFL
jgi:soluble lytic murein transglycosylase-like protein